MRFDKNLWQQAVLLDHALSKTDDRLNKRELFCRELGLSDRIASAFINALENIDLISGTAEQVQTATADTELILGDLHVPFHDVHALDKVLDYAVGKHNISMVALNGDVLDFYQISSFRKDPTRSERLYKEIAIAREVLEKIRSAFPNAEIRWLDGNHEERLQYYINDKAPQLKELLEGLLPAKLGFDELNIKKMTKYYKVGELWHVHGHERKGGWGVINVCRVMMDRVMDNFVTSHYHVTQEYIKKRIDDSIIGGWSVGHLAMDSAFDYNPLNNWNQGFAIVEYDERGEFTMHNNKICNGRIY
jgi:hypothetical protein